MDYNFKLGEIITPAGIKYNYGWAQRGMLKFPEDSKEYAFFFKIWVQMAKKLSLANYEGEVFKI